MKLQKRDPYWFSNEQILKAEELYDAKYLGPWCIKDLYGNWNEQPLDIFYKSNPDLSKGHSNYFGLYVDERTNYVMICNAKSAFEQPMSAILENNIIYISRWRHDYVQTPNGLTIDGGRDYCKTNTTTLISVVVRDGNIEIYQAKSNTKSMADDFIDSILRDLKEYNDNSKR